MARTLAGRLVEALFCGHPNRSKRVAVFIAHSDESASGDRNGTFLIGGYVASSDMWTRVTDAWQERVLDAEPRIPYLHMIEIRREEFQARHRLKKWQLRVNTAIDILVSSGGLQGVFAKIHQPDLEHILRRPLKKLGIRATFDLRDPDYLCYLAYAYHVLLEVRAKFPEAEKVDFVVDRKKKITNFIGQFHEGLIETLGEIDPPLQALAGRLIPDDMENSPALQAADVLCWHLRRNLDGDHTEDHNLARLELQGARRLRPFEYTRDDLEKQLHAIIKNQEIADAVEAGNG